MSDSTTLSSFVTISGDFASVFDHEDYIAMVNAQDEATVVLKAHLILEEFLNIWASKLTSASDLFAGTFVPFKTKLVICRNLGLSSDLFEVLGQFNEVRNRYSHRRKYRLEVQTIDSIRVKVDAIAGSPELVPCDRFEIALEGVDASQMRRRQAYTWASADSKKRVLVVLVVLVMKLVRYMQQEFKGRGIDYNLVLWPVELDGQQNAND